MALDFTACLRDTPSHRLQLTNCEADIEDLEQRLLVIVKLTGSLRNAGEVFSKIGCQLAGELGNLVNVGACSEDGEDPLSHAYDRFKETLLEIESFRSVLLKQMEVSLLEPLQQFLKNDMKEVKDLKKIFNKISGDMDTAYSKHGAVNHNKKEEIEQLSNVLVATGMCFNHTAIDYTYFVNKILAKKRFDIIEKLLGYMYSQFTFFHQGYDALRDMEPYMMDLGAKLGEMRECFQVKDKDMESRHSTSMNLTQDSERLGELSFLPPPLEEEGYLLKRSSNRMRTWKRRYFFVSSGQLLYLARTCENAMPTLAVDLRLCTVKVCPATSDCDNRRFCFELISPIRSYLLQADSLAGLNRWISALQNAISDALDAMKNCELPDDDNLGGGVFLKGKMASLTQKILDASKRVAGGLGDEDTHRLRAVRGNIMCADCGTMQPPPSWASISLGIILCIECSGIHRSLGTHISKVRSLTLDKWEPEVIDLMISTGNHLSNSIYEATYCDVKYSDDMNPFDNVEDQCEDYREETTTFIRRATSTSDRSEREAWIKAKYVDKLFLSYEPDGTPDFLGRLLIASVAAPSENIDSIREEDSNIDESAANQEDATRLFDMMRLLALGAPVSWSEHSECWSDALDASDDNDDDPVVLGRTALHTSAALGRLVDMELLLQNRAQVNAVDVDGDTPLHLASAANRSAAVCLLLKRGADFHVKNCHGSTALAIAIKAEHSNVVAAIQLAEMDSGGIARTIKRNYISKNSTLLGSDSISND